MKTKAWLLARSKEASTYRGLALVLGAAGVVIDPASLQAIASGVMALIGLIETLKKD